MSNLPVASIIIPCRNEEKFISNCLDSIIANNYPKKKLEVLVIDGMSDDRTREIVGDYSKKYPFIKLLENPQKIASTALNIGIKNAKGDIIVRMDAHAFYIGDYVSKCVKYLRQYEADNVGGIWKILPKEKTLVAKSIAFASSSLFGAGDAHYRRGYSGGLRLVDTVFGGCFRKEIFEKVGYFNEKLRRSQDMEFNLRLRKAGGKVLLSPDIVTCYYPKSNFKDFFIHNFEDGIWAVLPIKFVKTPFKWRHYFPLIFVLSLFGSGIFGIFWRLFFFLFLFIIGIYSLANIYFSLKTVIGEKDIRYIFIMPMAFATRHIGYGLGSIWGLIKLIFS